MGAAIENGAQDMTQSLPIWIDGVFLPAADAHVSVEDRSFLLGDGCFETLFYAQGDIEGVDEHMGLLQRSAHVLDIRGGPSQADIRAALARFCGLLAPLGKDAAIRMTLSRGAGGRGADTHAQAPTMVISASPLAHSRPFAPLKLATSRIRRNETSPLSRIKATCYGDNLAARREAAAEGADEALMLNTQGRVAGLAMGNIVLARAAAAADDGRESSGPGVIVTPPESEGVRPGYMRTMCLARAKAQGWRIEERLVEYAELLEPAVGVFGVNSLWGVRPVARLDGIAQTTDMTTAFSAMTPL